MSTRRLSASALERAEHCVSWLRDDYTWSEDASDSYAARSGSAAHEAAERWIREPHKLPDIQSVANNHRLTGRQIGLLSKQHEQWLAWVWQKWPGLNGVELRPEVKFAYDPETCTSRQLKAEGHRDYSEALPHEITGTADVVVLDKEGVSVLDWKFGRMPVRPPHENAQLRALSLFVARAYGVDRVKAGIVRGSDIDVYETTHVLEAFDFDCIIAPRLAQLHAKVAEEKASREGSPNPGVWCRYCPAKKACPAQKEKAA